MAQPPSSPADATEQADPTGSLDVAAGEFAEPTGEPHSRRGPQRSAVVVAVLDLAARASERLGRPVQVLDLGGGTGGAAVPLAAAGHQVTVVDPSPDALAALARRAAEAGLGDQVSGIQGIQGDGDSLETVVAGRTFDLVCCHGTLEHVDDPATTLRAIRAALSPEGELSLLVAGRLAVVLAKAVAGEFGQAKAALTSPTGRWGEKDPYPRRFDLDALEELLVECGFEPTQSRGIGILRQLVPGSHIDSDADRAALAELDDLLVADSRAFLRTLGSGLHITARRT